MNDRQPPTADNRWQQAHARLLLDSYARWTGSALLVTAGADPAHALYRAPFVVLSHDTAVDPMFNYANRAAQALFAMDWPAFVATPSRHSAEPLHREARAALMARVSRDGYIDDYEGIRISADGRRFRIHRAVVWNLVDAGGCYLGQAASFAHWTML